MGGGRALVLVVEDEPLIADVLGRYLRADGYQTALVANAEDALAATRNRRPDLILVDVNLPGRDGFSLLRQLGAMTSAPVIMVTARVEEQDRMLGFELGADDYVVKPFNPAEVVARVRAVLRRATSGDRPERPLRFGNVEILPDARVVSVAGVRIELTPSEHQVLEYLARHPRVAVSRARLLDTLEDSAATDRVVDAHVKSIRRKLRESDGDDLIETVRGVGYRLWLPS